MEGRREGRQEWVQSSGSLGEARPCGPASYSSSVLVTCYMGHPSSLPNKRYVCSSWFAVRAPPGGLLSLPGCPPNSFPTLPC